MQDVAALYEKAVLEELRIIIYLRQSPAAFFADLRSLSLSKHPLNSFFDKPHRPLHRLLSFGVAQSSRWRRPSIIL